MNTSQQIILSGIAPNELLEAVREIVRAEIQALPKPEKIKLYLNIDECSELTGRSKSALYQDTHLKRIPHLKRGGKLLFNRDAVIKWLEESNQNIEQ